MSLPAGWFSQDIGSPTTPGSVTYSASGNTIAVTGAATQNGVNFGSSYPEYETFCYEEVTGDVTITAKLLNFDTTIYSYSEIVMRQDLTTQAVEFGAAFSSSGICTIWRTGAGGWLNSTSWSGVSTPLWVRLAYTAETNTATISTSADGTSWTQIGSYSIFLSGLYFVGMTGFRLSTSQVQASPGVWQLPTLTFSGAGSTQGALAGASAAAVAAANASNSTLGLANTLAGGQTALDLMSRAMRLIGALSLGEVPTGDEEHIMLVALNTMLDLWAAERLLMFAIARNIYNLVAGQQVYQIGPNAPDWVAPRPSYLEGAGILLPGSDPTQTIERPLRVLTDAEYRAIRVKGVTSSIPTKLYYDHWFSNSQPASQTQTDFGSGNVFLWPCPSTAYSIALYAAYAVQQFTSVTQRVGLPPGYALAIPYNLAVIAAPEFDREPSELVVSIAESSLDKIRAANYRQEKLRSTDTPRSTGGRFDWQTGEIR